MQSNVNDKLAKYDLQNLKHSRKKHILRLANDLLDFCFLEKNQKNKPKKLDNIEQLNSDLFVYFFENICGIELIGIESFIIILFSSIFFCHFYFLIDKKYPTISLEDEIHNVQAVIDSISLDVLHEDLSHLTGESICGMLDSNGVSSNNSRNLLKRDYVSIEYLLDIFRSIYDWIKSKKINNNNEINSSNLLFISKNKEQEILDDTFFSFNEKRLHLEQNDHIFFDYMKKMENDFILNMNDHINYDSELNRDTSLLNENLKNFNSNVLNETENKSLVNKDKKVGLIDISKNNGSNQMTIPILNKNLQAVNSNSFTNLKKSDHVDFVLKSIYNEDIEDAKLICKQVLNKLKNNSISGLYTNENKTEKNKKSMTSKLKVRPSSAKKGVLLPQQSKLKRSYSSSFLTTRSLDTQHYRKSKYLSEIIIDQNGLLNHLLEEFPYLHTSPETIHYLWQTHSKQIELITKRHQEIEDNFLTNKLSNLNLDDQSLSASRDTKLNLYIKDLYKKQKYLMENMRKDLFHMERIAYIQKTKKLENAMKSKQREQRFQNAKTKRYYQEMCLKKKARLLKQATCEELIFKNLFNEISKLQKERILELKSYAKEKFEENNENELNKVKSIENFYRRKFDLINEKMKTGKCDSVLKQKSQHNNLKKINLEYRNKLESQILDLQEQLCRDKDFLYWRELEANRIKSDLNNLI
jgi:hypothetical protein